MFDQPKCWRCERWLFETSGTWFSKDFLETFPMPLAPLSIWHRTSCRWALLVAHPATHRWISKTATTRAQPHKLPRSSFKEGYLKLLCIGKQKINQKTSGFLGVFFSTQKATHSTKPLEPTSIQALGAAWGCAEVWTSKNVTWSCWLDSFWEKNRGLVDFIYFMVVCIL